MVFGMDAVGLIINGSGYFMLDKHPTYFLYKSLLTLGFRFSRTISDIGIICDDTQGQILSF